MASIRQWPRMLWNRINPPLDEEQRAVYAFDVYGDADVGTRTYSGAFINETTAFKYGVAYAAMTLIADGIAGLKPHAMKELDDGTEERAKLPTWIKKPHFEMRRFDVYNQILLSVLAWGNAYALLVRRPTDNVIIGLEVMDPSEVHPEWDPNQPFRRRYKVGKIYYNSSEMFHLQGPTLPGEPAGLSVIAAAREAIGLGLTLEEFGARYFGQGSQQKIVIETQRELTTEEAARMIKTYERFHKGRGNWHRPAIMSGGNKLHNISIPPNDAQFLESRQFQAIDVARWFRVPPHRVGIIGVQTSWGSGLAEENLAMLQHTFLPWINRLEEALSWYTPNDAVHVHLNTEDLLKPTFQENAELWSGLWAQGLAKQNEARQHLGLDKVPDGDQFIFEIEELLAMQQGQAGSIPTAQGGAPASDTATKEKDRKRKQTDAKK